MTQARFYTITNLPLSEIAGAAADFFRQDGFDTNVFTDFANRTVLQVGKERGARFLFGLAYSLTVIMTPQPDGRVLVELGGESWGDKVGSGVVGAIFFAPLLFTAAYGAWQQSELDDRFWGFLDNYIYNRTGQPPQPVNAVPYYNNSTPAPQGDYGPFYSSPPPAPPSQPYNYQAYQNYTYGYAPQGGPQPAYTVPNIKTQPAFPHKSSWFDDAGMQPIFEQQVGKMASWQTVIADGVITYQELNQQQDRVQQLQQHAEQLLDTNAKLKLAETLHELGRLEQLQRTALTNSFSTNPPKDA